MLEPVAKLRNLTILPLASLRSVSNAACAAAVAVAHQCERVQQQASKLTH